MIQLQLTVYVVIFCLSHLYYHCSDADIINKIQVLLYIYEYSKYSFFAPVEHPDYYYLVGLQQREELRL